MDFRVREEARPERLKPLLFARMLSARLKPRPIKTALSERLALA
jgi:hypothetical protein